MTVTVGWMALKFTRCSGIRELYGQKHEHIMNGAIYVLYYMPQRKTGNGAQSPKHRRAGQYTHNGDRIGTGLLTVGLSMYYRAHKHIGIDIAVRVRPFGGCPCRP